MPSAPRNAHLSIRLNERDKATFVAAAERCKMDPSVGARQLIELVTQRLENGGGDLLDVLYELKNTWPAPSDSAASVSKGGSAKR